MNKLLLSINAVLVIAVAYLFYKTSSVGESKAEEPLNKEAKTDTTKKSVTKIEAIGTTPTGKIAFINLDELNEKSTEVADLEKEAKSRKNSIEGSLQALSNTYQKEMIDYQNAAKAGLLPESEMAAKAKKIQQLEADAQNKQLQMDNLTMDVTEKNIEIQKKIKLALQKWNAGKYDYIFSYSESVPTMLLGNATLDITEEIVVIINEDYSVRKAALAKK